MRDTKPPKATGSGQAYRDAASTPTATAPVLKALAETALAVLARSGARTADNAAAHYAATTDGGVRFDITCAGPALPATVPAETVHPSMIPKQRLWRGTYRLQVKAPILAFDLCWNEGEPLRIMQFSRGDWERELAAMAR
ncbi:MAG: hypothetical protein KIT16_08805 [Rhodospirillaceae bacterium]|nr:hypothetical protein [Rhodospirillaceae bacterium]